MRKSAFALCEDHNAYIGYTSGRTWNGWATPYFTLEEAQRLQADFNQGIENPMLYDVNKDAFVLKYEEYDEPYIWEGEDIQTVDGIKHLYGIGAYSHIWDELDDDIKRSLAQQVDAFLYEYDDGAYEDYHGNRDVVKIILSKLADIEILAQTYTIMNDDSLDSDEIYTKLDEVLKL